jgi:hypothetical protein
LRIQTAVTVEPARDLFKTGNHTERSRWRAPSASKVFCAGGSITTFPSSDKMARIRCKTAQARNRDCFEHSNSSRSSWIASGVTLIVQIVFICTLSTGYKKGELFESLKPGRIGRDPADRTELPDAGGVHSSGTYPSIPPSDDYVPHLTGSIGCTDPTDLRP